LLKNHFPFYKKYIYVIDQPQVHKDNIIEVNFYFGVKIFRYGFVLKNYLKDK